jgi:sugar phosphate isomerase/epimerase
MQKISFTTLSTPGLDVRAVAALARLFGYDGVDLRVSARAGEILPDTTERELRMFRDMLASEGVEAAGLLCYLSYGGDLAASRLEASLREQLVRQMAIAELLEAQSIRIGGSMTGSRSHAGELANALGCVLKQNGGIDIVIQNHVGEFSAAQCIDLVEELGHPRFKLAFSPDHCVVVNEDFASLLPRLKGKVRKLFISDTKRQDDGFTTVLPGLGGVPLGESYEAVGGSGYDGWITFKYEKFWDPGLEGPETSLPYFIERAPAWFAGWKK